MKWLLLIRPEAEQDLALAHDWYEKKSAGLGEDFLDAISAALREVVHSPERPRLYYRSFRRVLLRRFPYKIFYQVVAQRVVVFRVLHAKQDHPRGLT